VRKNSSERERERERERESKIPSARQTQRDAEPREIHGREEEGKKRWREMLSETIIRHSDPQFFLH
jgi:hypothetical protein